MAVVRKIIAVLATVLLAASLLGAGFAACTALPVTSILANVFSDDAASPFSRSQLVQVAEATRDYSFGAHDERALYAALYEVDLQLAETIERTAGTLPRGFPDLSAVSGAEDTSALKNAFAKASEIYCFSAKTVSHLDDCHAIARVAYPLLAIAALTAIASLIATGVLGGKRKAGAALLAAGVAVLVAFGGLDIWAAIDFTGLFASLHQLFFSQGNWVFPYDSLLICALPTAFWMGMGVVWLATSAVASILCVVIGVKVRH